MEAAPVEVAGGAWRAEKRDDGLAAFGFVRFSLIGCLVRSGLVRFSLFGFGPVGFGFVAIDLLLGRWFWIRVIE